MLFACFFVLLLLPATDIATDIALLTLFFYFFNVDSLPLVVPLALGLQDLANYPQFDDPAHLHQKELEHAQAQASTSASTALASVAAIGSSSPKTVPKTPTDAEKTAERLKRVLSFHGQIADHEADHTVENFTAKTRCVVYGIQARAVQGMLDFDYMCKRSKPSVAAMIFPFSANHYMKVRAI